MNRFLVGGAVRDQLLNCPVKERDWLVVDATPDELIALGFQPVGTDFTVFLHPETREEYALPRGYAASEDPLNLLQEDLQRRDLTINAMAQGADGRLIDPFGGQRDLHARILRHVSPAFADDPLRVLRVARFAARYAHLGFSVAPETLALMAELAAKGALDELVPERVWSELLRALREAQPTRFIQVLRDCGALVRIFPEIDCLFGVPQPAQYHPEVDTATHTLMALQQAVRLSSAPEVRFAVLVHDLGKGLTPSQQWPRHVGHEERGARQAELFAKRLRIPNAFRELGVLVARYHTHCHRALELRPATLVDLLAALDAFRRPERLESFLLACEADARGRLGFEERSYPQAQHLRNSLDAAQKIQGASLAARGLRGKALGKQLRQERIAAIRQALPKDQ